MLALTHGTKPGNFLSKTDSLSGQATGDQAVLNVHICIYTLCSWTIMGLQV